MQSKSSSPDKQNHATQNANGTYVTSTKKEMGKQRFTEYTQTSLVVDSTMREYIQPDEHMREVWTRMVRCTKEFLKTILKQNEPMVVFTLMVRIEHIAKLLAAYFTAKWLYEY